MKKMNRREAIKLSGALFATAAAGCQTANPKSCKKEIVMETVQPPFWKTRPEDQEFFEREIQSFLPDRLFDAHCHIWNDPENKMKQSMGTRIDFQQYQELMDQIHPGRKMGALFLPIFEKDSTQEEIIRQNEWISSNRQGPLFRGSFLITGKEDPEWLRQEMKRLDLCGLKCYHFFADSKPTWEAEIPEYLPERLVRIAHEEEWVITLHMVKSRAAADPSNIHWIRHYCNTYPNMKLILAHSARAFQPSHALEGLPQLTGLDNLYFDTSANCEPIAHQAILRIMGHKRMMYGTDMPVSHGRGRCVAVADTFLWLYQDSPVWKEKHIQINPVFTGLECLRGLKWACWSEKLSDSAIEDIFWNNAANLFNISNS